MFNKCIFLKKFAAVFCLSASILLTAGCADENAESADDAAQEDGKLKVSVSFDALKEFAEAVGKDKIAVSVVIPTGTEPHDFEPKGKDLAKLSKADVFVYSGFGMEPWAEKAVSGANNDRLIAAELSKNIDGIKLDESEGHGQYDPHTWLSLKNAQIEVRDIKDALVKADPDNKDYYEQNCREYTAQLEKLYNDYYEKFQNAPHKNFVTGHAAFAYLCRDFNLKQSSVEDTFAEGEPTPQKLAKLADYCKQNNVKVIFAEEMASPEISRTLADEVGAEIETVYTIESAEDNLSYIERMQSNLDKIYSSLQ